MSSSPSACDYDSVNNPLGLKEYERTTPRYHSTCPGVRHFTVSPGPDNKYGDRSRELCVGYSTRCCQLVFLHVEGRKTEFPIYVYLSAPYMSHIQVQGEDPAGWYFGLYTQIGDWFNNEMIAQGIIRDTGKKTHDSWHTEMPIFELLLHKNEIIYTCDADCGKIELVDVGKMEDRFKQCSKCKIIRYCSQKCQAANWKSHKTECRLMLGQDLQTLESNRMRGSDAAHIAEGGEVQSYPGGERIYTFPK